MGLAEIFNRVAVGRLAVAIQNRNQEKEFINICRKADEPYARKDATTYIDKEEKEPIYPVYYGFISRNEKRIGWCDIDKEYLEEAGYLFIDFKDFKRQYEREEQK